VVLELGIRAPSKGGKGSIPTQRTKISEAVQHDWRKRKEKKERERERKERRKEGERKEKRKKVGRWEQGKESVLPSHFPATFAKLTPLSA